MSYASVFYAERVAKAGAEAAATPLSNVRNGWLRAQAAWQVLLDREEHAAAIREARKV